ncbi:MAG: penicillin-binding protein 1A [Aquincola tertiaricarbonis]|uniref:penicillin-binding protein 1A n=1 Tax=Aquincola TaxID=391952 RepID=UPI000614E06C|nr:MULTISPECIES: penicillin-binding protein 1A [Aquincola]MCR5865615.1 penicillin-binding protein 1A [Aquincola sp. J276]
MPKTDGKTPPPAPRAPRPAPPTPAGSSWAASVGRIVAWLFGLAAAGGIAVLVLLAIALSVAYPNLPEISGLTDYRPKLPMRIYSGDNVLLAEYGEERRNFVPIGEMPTVMKNAVLSIEDARFYQHGGVDYLGVLRAGLAQFSEAKSQGASTITMQVARNFYLSTEKTFTRKIYEILLALKIERQLSKDQILELYMNQIYLGQRAYGFAAASEIYFGKPLREVTVAEAAMLAGLPKAPSAYNPIVNPKRATTRQQYIIERMRDNGFINADQAREAAAQPLRYRAPSEVPVHAEFAAEAARQLVYNQYGNDAYTRGLNVYLTLKAPEQMAGYRALRSGLIEYERRQVYRGPEAYVVLPTDPADIDTHIAEALADHPDNDDLKAAVVLEASPRKVVAVLQSGESITVTGNGLKPVASGLSDKAAPQKQIRRGAVVRAVQVGKEWALTQVPEVEGALIAMSPTTGAISALVGGFDYRKSKFNHVTQAWRQPGSSFKPFIYSAALEKGFTPVTVVNDAPLFFNAGSTGSQPWEPKNYDGKFDGPMAMHTALAKSKNMVSIRVLQSIGAPFAQDWLTRFGFEAEKHPAYLTMALGAGSVTPMEMASAYSVFANGGYRVPPVLISRITDSRGRTLQERKLAPPDESARVISARNAFVMGTLLQEVVRSGTGNLAARTLKRPDLFGKTGTTNDSLDAWFAGWQPSTVAVVWVGYDQPRKLGDRETGGGLALPIWTEFMGQAIKNVPVTEASAPSGVVNVGGQWVFEEFGQGAGVSSLGLEDRMPQAPTEDEKRGILDLFRR